MDKPWYQHWWDFFKSIGDDTPAVITVVPLMDEGTKVKSLTIVVPSSDVKRDIKVVRVKSHVSGGVRVRSYLKTAPPPKKKRKR